MTPTEFRVFDYLVEHVGQVVPHQELLDAVWPDALVEPQAVKNKIHHLRRLLEDEPQRPRYIETLPRRGYRLVGGARRATPMLGSRRAGWSAAKPPSPSSAAPPHGRLPAVHGRGAGAHA